MQSSRRLGWLLGWTALLAGCAGSQVAVGFRPHAIEGADPDVTWHVNVDVWGYYFLAKFPLVTGSVDQPGRLAWFTDTVNTEAAVRLVGDAATSLGADVEIRDLQTVVVSNWLALVLWLPEAQASATLVGPSARRAIPPLQPVAQRKALPEAP